MPELWRERTVNLTANQIFELVMEDSVNTLLIRNPSSTVPVYIDLRRSIQAGDYETLAPVDGWGVLTRPHAFKFAYLLATQDVKNVRVYEIFTENPVITLPLMLRSTLSDVNVTSTVGLKPGDLNLDAQKDLQVDVKTLPSLPAGANLIGTVDINSLPNVNLAGVTGQKMSAGAAGDITVKGSAGKVYAVRAGTGVNITLKDGATEKWYIPAGSKDEFNQPLTCGTSIVLNFSAAGDAWILYQ